MPPTEEWLREQKSISTEWAQGILARRDWVICDTETTGIHDSAEIIEIALLFSDGHICVEQRLRPLIPIPPDATAIHGITNAEIAHCPTWQDIHHTLRVLLYKRLVLAYNAQYDIRLIAQSASAWGLPTPVHFSDCVMLQYARYMGDWWSSKQDFKWPKLPTMEGGTAHNALSDCRSTLEVLRRMAHGG